MAEQNQIACPHCGQPYALTAEQAEFLALSAGHPCALVTRYAYDLAGHCVEVRHTRGDAHAFHYTVAIT